MTQFENLFVLPLLVAAIGAYFSTPLIIKMSWKLGLVDDPKKNKHPKVIHDKPTPRSGGLAAYIGICLASMLFLPLDHHLAAILAGATILLVMGLLDDKYDINPYVRLSAQFLAAAIPIASGIGVAFISNPFAGGVIDLSQIRLFFEFAGEGRSIWVLSSLFGLFWIVTLMNFLNMGAKGVDGQLAGVVAIAAITIALMSYRFSADIAEWPVIVLAAIVAGAFLGFLPWSAFPQKIMPGFTGSNLGGYFLAILSILTTTKVGVLAIVLAIPLIDTGYTVIRRVAKGKSPVWGDRGHLHHRLLDSGWTKPKVASFYWLITAVLGIVALSVNAELKFYTIIGIALLLGGLILWLTYRPKH